MRKYAFSGTFVFCVLSLTSVECGPKYWAERRAIVEAESCDTIGGRLPFEKGEHIPNDVLMLAKRNEIAKGFFSHYSITLRIHNNYSNYCSTISFHKMVLNEFLSFISSFEIVYFQLSAFPSSSYLFIQTRRFFFWSKITKNKRCVS